MNINDTIFFDCMCNGNGGAIYFSDGLNLSLYRLCALKCKGTNNSHGQFAYIYSNNYHIVEYISISKCYNISNGWSPVFFRYGNQNISNINSSINRNLQSAAIYYYYPNRMNSIHCTFYNNRVLENRCIYFFGHSGNIVRSNIVDNNSPSLAVISVEGSGDYNFIESIFYDNKNTLFIVWATNTIRLIHCIINHQFTLTTSTPPIYTALLITNSTNTFTIIHYSTQFQLFDQLIICNTNNQDNTILFFNNKFFKVILIFNILIYIN